MNVKLEEAKKRFWSQARFYGVNPFHYKDGIYFIRHSRDRSVTILEVHFHPETNSVPDTQCEWECNLRFEINVDEHSWPSVVAAVSGKGSDADTWQIATDLHQKV